MTKSMNQPQNAPFFNKIANLSLEELERFATKTLQDFKSNVKLIEESQLKDEDFMQFVQEVTLEVNQASSAIGIIEDVHPKKEFRDLSGKFNEELGKLYAKYNLNQKIYKKYRSIKKENLSKSAKYLHKKVMEGYIRSGVDKPKEIRDQIQKRQEELSELSVKFNRNIAEGTPIIKLDKEELEGCFKDFIDSRINKIGKVEIKLVTDATLHILQNCKVKETRELVREKSLNYAKKSNQEVLPRYLNLMEEIAQLIGFKNYAEIATQDKMIENPKKAEEFINELLNLTKERTDTELKAIKKLHDENSDKTPLTYADIDYYGNQIASKLSTLDEEELNQYFPYKHVKNAILECFEEMFDLKFKPNKEALTWHKDVDVLNVIENDEVIGIIYLDMHPREGKYNHAYSSGVVSGIKGSVLPQNVLVCNFNQPSAKSAGLQSLGEVSTFFHEFGHLLHSVLGGQKGSWSSLAGTNTQWDFVEAPSQLLEEIMLDSEVLKRLGSHIENKSSLPTEIIEKIKQKDGLYAAGKLKGLGIARQAVLAKMSLAAFITKKVTNIRLKNIEQSAMKEAFGVYGDYSMIYEFGHLDGYYSNYYTYMWSLAISKDLFTKFNENNLLDKKVAEHYRKTILEPGGSKPAAELVRDFLGRDWNMNAFKEYLKEGEELLEKI
jgi:thimet oligopeptidase